MLSFAKKQMQELGVTEENNFHPFRYHPETGEKSETPRSYYQEYFVELTAEIIRSEFKNQKGIQPGDLMINYFDLCHYPYKYERDGTRWDKPYRIVRLQEPLMSNGNEMKYKLPYKADTTRPFLSSLIIEAYQEGRKIPTLVLTEGAKKAYYACQKGIPTIGFTSITHYKHKSSGAMHPEVMAVIRKCEVQDVVMLYDGDCVHISTKALAAEEDLYKRPQGFFSSIRSIHDLLKDYINQDLFQFHFAYIQSEEIDGKPKGLDDLLIECKDSVLGITEELLSFKSTKSNYFKKINISYGLSKVHRELSLNSVEAFYQMHETLIEKKKFKFNGTTYVWEEDKQKLVILRPGDADKYIRVGDQYHEHCQIPDQHNHLQKYLVARSKSTIVDDHGKNFLDHVSKFTAFCNIPDHINYQQIIHNCWNAYYEFSHEPKEDDCTITIGFLKHIFGVDHFEIGLDYIQLLYQKPQQKLPILCLVSEEQQTGKSTLLFWLKDIFTENCAIVGNADLQNDFNAFWATKLIVGCEEAFLEKKVIVEKIKALSTGNKITVNAKGKDQFEVDFFAKFIFTSNNEQQVVPLTDSDTRYFVVKVPTIPQKRPDFADKLKAEIPAFLDFMNKREMSVPKSEDRMWFDFSRYRTRAFDKVVKFHKSTADKEIREALEYVFEHNSDCVEILMTVKDVSDHFFGGRKFESNYIRRVLEKDLNVDRYKEFYAKIGWFKTLDNVPERYREDAEFTSKSMRYEFFVVEKTFNIDDKCYEYLSRTVKSHGRPYVFKREVFYKQDNKRIIQTEEQNEINFDKVRTTNS